MTIPFSVKVNERLIGSSISAEPHIIGIVGTATYAPGFIRLTEVPQGPAPAVTIPGYTEIASGTPTSTQFLVDYTTGVVTFATSQDGNSISASYMGLGSEFAAEDINELQNPLGTIASQSITYNWPSAPTVSWALAPLNQALNANSHKINNVTDPTSAQDAATKNYVDSHTSPAGSNTQIQYNNSGVFGASPNFTFDPTLRLLTIIGNAAIHEPILALNDSAAGGQVTFNNDLGNIQFSSIIGDQLGGLTLFSQPNTGFIQIQTNVSTSPFVWIFQVDGSLLLPSLVSVPGVPTEGEIIYNSTTHQWQGWNGSSWAILG